MVAGEESSRKLVAGRVHRLKGKEKGRMESWVGGQLHVRFASLLLSCFFPCPSWFDPALISLLVLDRPGSFLRQRTINPWCHYYCTHNILNNNYSLILIEHSLSLNILSSHLSLSPLPLSLSLWTESAKTPTFLEGIQFFSFWWSFSKPWRWI